jgi:hypothetical protein
VRLTRDLQGRGARKFLREDAVCYASAPLLVFEVQPAERSCPYRFRMQDMSARESDALFVNPTFGASAG